VKRNTLVLVTVLMILSLLVAGCGPTPEPQVVKETVMVTEKETVVVTEKEEVEVTKVVKEEVEVEKVVTATPQPREVVIALEAEPRTLDPNMHSDFQTMKINPIYMDTLVWAGFGIDYRPALATSWETVDEVTWRFKLREGVTFHNGEPFNAESVKFTVDRIMDPALESPQANTITPLIQEAQVVDEYTVDIITKSPYPGLLAQIALLNLVPPEYVEEVGNEAYAQNPVGCGPFEFVEWVPGDHLTFVAYEDYWGGPPDFDVLTLRPILEEATRIAAFQAGEVDIIQNISPELASQVENYGEIQVLEGARQVYLAMDTKNPPFDDVRVRQAMNYGIDIDAIAESLMAGWPAVRATGGFVPATVGYDPSVKPYPFDPEKAASLLADAGYADGFDIPLNITLTGEGIVKTQDLAEAIQAYLGELGVNVEIVIHENAVFWQQYHSVGFENGMYIASWSIGQNEGRHLMPMFDSETRGYYYANAEQTDPLLDACLGTIDIEGRKAACGELQAWLQEDTPWVFLYAQPALYGVSKRIVWGGTRDDYLFHPIEIKMVD
jgi:peptide/nickel transport system substrate-binding protein